MKKLAVFCGSIILSALVLAQETEDFTVDDYSTDPNVESLLKASEEAIEAVTESCRSWATDDEIEEAELASYLLNCVNEELLYQGYSPVTSID